MTETKLLKQEEFYVGHFSAMASPCELLIDTGEQALAQYMLECVASEALRIEKKFSRYRNDNVIYQINNSQGKTIEVDDELARLLDFSEQCYQMSDGLFDITSGVLRRIWKFDSSDRIPSRKQAKALLPLVGWSKVTWKKPFLTLPAGMEIDLGGIGKEYAVDSAAKLLLNLNQNRSLPFLINFGGDLFANLPPAHKKFWQVGIEAIGGSTKKAVVQLVHGGLATSGDARRFLLKGSVRYSHVLNPRTGWSVSNAPRSVSVLAPTCVQAGFISTLAMLKGKEAENFLAEQDLQYWIQKD